ncbi:MAG: ATP-binding protein, partial [Lysobacterales bacterium]
GEIEGEYHHYQNISYLRSALKKSFILILSLVLLLTVLMAILAALKAARRLVTPISNLALATREVAAGDLSQAVEGGTRDELGFLVQSFNEMTAALNEASDAAERSRAQLQSQSEYLQTVLGSLTAGVLTLDNAQRIVTANAAAEQILGLPAQFLGGHTMAELVETAPFLAPLADLIGHFKDRGPSEWQREIQLQPGEHVSGGNLVLLVRGSNLGEALSEHGGSVVVFDDVTILNQAQRQAAWAEVAQRLAHEVKNPLTPIRLAAERLHLKLMDKLQGKDAGVLAGATGTIISQVDALRSLVDAFGDYASEPRLERKPLRLDELIRDVVSLYQQGDQRVQFQLDLLPGPEGFSADAGQIRQLLHNLIRNASEAAGEGVPAQVRIQTRELNEGGRRWLQLEVCDQGPGYPEAVLAKPFEPYVTFKRGGSGLGLAICRKIAVDHDGRISIDNPAGGGARTTVRLPL